MKKNKKTIQDNANSTKVIPPYPRWVKICCVLLWGLIMMGFAADMLSIDNFAKLFLYLSFLLVMVVCGYGIYRAVRYFPIRNLCISILLCAVGISVFFYSLLFYDFSGGSENIFYSIVGLFFGRGILAMAGKPIHKWGWFIFYMILFFIGAFIRYRQIYLDF